MNESRWKELNEQALTERRDKMQEFMRFLGALAAGCDKILVKRSAMPTARKVGKEAVLKLNPKKTQDVEEALEILDDVLKQIGIWWGFYLWKPQGETEYFKKEGNKIRAKIVFTDCMIRNILYTFAHEQKGALCYMNHGFFEGALEAITGMSVRLEIIHAGENACIKELTLEAE
jgi:predicted hydrocarbon binding protein